MRYGMIKKRLDNLCRDCLNREYGIGLEPEDCRYFAYPSACASCGKVKNIVVKISFSKRMMIRFWRSK